ncbi:Peptidase family M23 [Microbacterium sp. cf046]|uniref:M23 family metallopeptidase n=1 Tax=Microbacterium sp. cf046 TaxID=1761803 RepID=UPI0008E2CA42|nr:M23 family metallopeptidase [Microbacterium sp. cf046]SFR92634.1 Peptidase family M23 [Microbacterium sp. cf046]
MPTSTVRFAALVIGAAAVVLTGCTAPTPTATATPTAAPDESEAEMTTVDEFSPLIISMTEPDPIPVHGTDGRYHLVYELIVQNASPRPASIDSIVTSAAGQEVGELSGADVIARTLPIGDYPFPPEALTEIPPGTTALVLMDTTFDNRDDVPAVLDQTISATFGDLRPNQANFASLFPTEAVASATTPVGEGEPVVIGPPLAGSDWVAVNACCSLSPHRGAMVPIGGRINAAERYAIDWSRFDLLRPPVENGVPSTFEGDPADNASYFTYDQPVLAVGDGEVVVVVDDLPDAEPGVLQDSLPLKDYGGNVIVLKIAPGVYAFYAHLKPGSLLVEVGDTVELGDELARTGNSGNTTESHLHFHVMDGIAPLTATNLPFEIDSFTMLGSGSEDGSEFLSDVSERSNELPLILSAISFPE